MEVLSLQGHAESSAGYRHLCISGQKHRCCEAEARCLCLAVAQKFLISVDETDLKRQQLTLASAVQKAYAGSLPFPLDYVFPWRHQRRVALLLGQMSADQVCFSAIRAFSGELSHVSGGAAAAGLQKHQQLRLTSSKSKMNQLMHLLAPGFWQ